MNLAKKKKYQFYETPEQFADSMCDSIFDPYLNKKVRILEPSAGKGALLSAVNRWFNSKSIHCEIAELTAIEYMEDNYKYLQKSFPEASVYNMDFLDYDEYINYFDYVIANPPFCNGQDLRHFMKMYEVCKPGGVIICVMSTGWLVNAGNKFKQFREWLGIQSRGQQLSWLEETRLKEAAKGSGDCLMHRGDEQILMKTYPSDLFRISGASVHTCTLQIKKQTVTF